MAVFKDAGAVVTTPSSGTYVIECIGNVGVLADMIGARVREVGGDDAVRRVEEAFRLGSAEGTSSRPARGAKGSAAARAASKTKREPSKTKAAIAAAKRRARIKAEKLAAEEEAKRSSREALLRASRARASPGTSYDPAEGPLATRRDRALDVEEDVAEAAEAMRGMIPAAPPSGLGLPPDADAAPASDGEEVFETREDDRSEERERSGVSEPKPERTAASPFEARLRERFPRGAAFAFDRKEAAVCQMRGWDRVAACRVRRVSADGVHVACRTAETDGAFVGAFCVPPRAATRVLVHRAPSPEALGQRGEEKTPPAFPSGSAERRRAVASAETAAAALAAARREGPGAFAPGSWVLERRAAAEAAAAAASRRKPPRGADAREPSAPPERAAGLAMPSLARDVALLAREVASFRRETTEGLASACASLERVVESIRELRRGEAKKENRARDRDARRGGEVADARAREQEQEQEQEQVPVAAGAPAAAPEDPSPFERSAFVAEARALASLGEKRKSAKKTASSGGARGVGAATASEGAEKKGEATRGETRPFSLKGDGERASPNLSRSTSQVVPETPADGVTVAGIEGSGAGGERFQTPRGGVEADASDGGAADSDVPEDPGVLLEPLARICSECRLRCQTRRELIDHMLETHGVEARAREEVDGPRGDLAGTHPFAGS